jgi:hypothetical protein
MSEPRDDVPVDDLLEQERGLDEPPAPEPDDTLPDVPSLAAGADADEADLLEQSVTVEDLDDDGYPYGTEEE